ncbi:superoxide dismutase family protein [Conservatibacter flavescens]|uniref:Superoxide dismutase [Cu-Zn] n=1 Tax=Conservatibacter flavescens TaxID=28161 RepID=A0A2M8RZX5_9PAST|nr:superoxide dismutase family protein [Conservatibacter flavescens]PJG84418.1 superoxide dismutase [Conservatibacter flavescens]
MKLTLKSSLIALGLAGMSSVAFADAAKTETPVEKIVVQVQQLDPEKGNKDVGTVEITESAYGLVFTPNLQGLTSGVHGFHIHQNPSCEPKEKDGKLTAGLAAGGHWDPKETKAHGFPWSDQAHLGDLPVLVVLEDGTATTPVLAPRLQKLADVKERALMIHAGGDNHSDHPTALGGGGARMACGVIK